MSNPAAIVADMTRAEQLALVRGAVDPDGIAAGYVPGNAERGLPPLRLVDGPLGARIPDAKTTAFPAPIATAASFDPALVRRVNAAIAREAAAGGGSVLLAPGCNLIRVPQNGRTFEYFSEDPVMTAQCAAAAVEGIQSESVIATPKHYVANAQETDRATIDVGVSERALRECYLPGFRAAVAAGAGGVMAALNGVDGTRMSEHRRLLTDVLKDEWGFDGFVVSDWWGTGETIAAANAGLDLEMPGAIGPTLDPAADAALPDGLPDLVKPVAAGMPDPTDAGSFGDALGAAVDAGAVPPARLADMARRIVRAMCTAAPGEPAPDLEAHHDLARRVAARGSVLLENDGTAPISPDADVALVGPNVETATLGGGGSSETTPVRAVDPGTGLRERSRGDVAVRRGHPRIPTPSFFDLMRGEDVVGTPEETPSIDRAVEAARAADVAVVVLRDWRTESADCADLELPGRQGELVRAVAEANPRTIAVVQAGGPMSLPWRHEVAALLVTWFPGGADGAALADVLYGDVDPGGRLPVTFADADAFPTSDPAAFPGIDGRVAFTEECFVGYRHFDRTGATPQYPFGAGSSYASFAFGTARAVDERTAQVDVTNEADRDGRVVVQGYREPDASDRPERLLAGFAAVEIPAGETRSVDVPIAELALRRWEGGWRTDPAPYTIALGTSSRDVRTRVHLG